MNSSTIKKVPSFNNTIDEKHTEMLMRFDDIENNIIPSLKKERNQLMMHLKNMNKSSNIEKYMDTADNIQEIRQKINQLKNEKKKYLLDNSKYIFQYFEDMKKISSGDNNQNKRSFCK